MFAAHYAYHAPLRGIAADSAANGEAAVSRQYAGRVPFELLQNALDRAAGRVVVRHEGGQLVVANDGRAVSCDPGFRHGESIGPTNRPSDFHSLCSMHTSNKSPDDDNGNKGVGFRSVFSVAARVMVWSRLEGGGWWGLLLVRDLDRDAWQAAADDPTVAAGLAELLAGCDDAPLSTGDRRPSFHFPLPLRSGVAPVVGLEWARTIIVLPCEDEAAERSVAASLASLRRSHLEFIGLRGRAPITVDIGHDLTLTTAASDQVVDRWQVDAASGEPPPPLFVAAHKAGLDVRRRIGGAVRWPLPESDVEGKIYCHLATEVSCPFSIDLHADLQTGIDRKHLDVQPAEAVGAYNRQLLLRGIDLHMAQIEARAGDREDLWRLLDPGADLANLPEDADPVRFLLTWGLSRHLFPASGGRPTVDTRSWATWAKLAARCFDGRPRTVRAFRQFWEASEHWINAVRRSGTKSAHQLGLACLAALRDAGAKVVPVTTHADLSDDAWIDEAVPPPAGGEIGGGRSDEKLFHVSEAQREYLEAVEVPVAIRLRDRRVTSWPVPEPFRRDGRLVGSVPFDRAALLQELRQLTGRPDGFMQSSEGQDVAVQRQVELIRFAARVFTLSVREGQALRSYAEETWSTLPGWRADHDDKPAERFPAGRAIATLFLPTRDGRWAPARQLTAAAVAEDVWQMVDGLVPGRDGYRAFLSFLGVAVWAGELPVVEGGDEGVVDPLNAPPALVDPATGLAIPPLAIPLSLIETGTIAHRVELAWGEWLPGMARREAERPHRLRVLTRLGEYAFVPVGEGPGQAMPPAHVESTPTVVAPRRITLLARQPQRVDDLLWRVRATDGGWLRACGARRLDERLEDPGLAVELIRELRAAYPEPSAAIAASPSVGFVLVEIFSRALDAIVKADATAWPEDLPLLSEVPDPFGRRTSALRWCGGGQIWVATDSGARSVLRRMAQDLPLLVTTVGPRQASGTPVAGRLVDVRAVVEADAPTVDDGVLAVRSELEALLARLLALAEVSRRYNRVVDPTNVADRWRSLELYRAADVWRRWTFAGTDLRRDETDRRGKYDDVMHVDSRRGNEPVGRSEVFYDVPPERLGESPRPPWTHFAEALAEILLDRAVEPDWRAALGEYEAGGEERLRDYLERAGVHEDLVDAMRAGLAPLAESEIEAHRATVSEVLARFDLALTDASWTANGSRSLVLDRHVAVSARAGTSATEDEVNAALASACFPGEQARFIPRVVVSPVHLAGWHRLERTDHIGVRLLRLGYDLRHGGAPRLRDEDLASSEVGLELGRFVEEAARRLVFDPESVAMAWLGREGALVDVLPPFSEYRPVTVAPARATWTALPARDARPSTSTATPPTKEEVEATDAAKAAKGDGAEVALLDWVVSRTSELLAANGEEALRVLLVAFPETGKARDIAEKALRAEGPETLRDALWVSRRWRGSGFDIVGLDLSDGRLAVRRYEVKALPDQPNVRLFVSSNELAVYRATRVPEAATRPDLRSGTWDLVGVRPSGQAWVLTDALDPVRDPSVGGLGQLRAAGFAPDDLQLVLRIEEEPDLVTAPPRST